MKPQYIKPIITFQKKEIVKSPLQGLSKINKHQVHPIICFFCYKTFEFYAMNSLYFSRIWRQPKFQDENRPSKLNDKITKPQITLVMVRLLWFYSHRC